MQKSRKSREERYPYHFTTSAIPLPWPSGFRPVTLRPPLSVEFALFGSTGLFIGIFVEGLKSLLVARPARFPDRSPEDQRWAASLDRIAAGGLSTFL